MVVQSLNSKLDLASELCFHPDAPYHISDETSMWELSRWQHPRIIPINHCAAYYYCLARGIILIIATSPQGTRYSPITWPYVYWLWTDKHETPTVSYGFFVPNRASKACFPKVCCHDLSLDEIPLGSSDSFLGGFKTWDNSGDPFGPSKQNELFGFWMCQDLFSLWTRSIRDSKSRVLLVHPFEEVPFSVSSSQRRGGLE